MSGPPFEPYAADASTALTQFGQAKALNFNGTLAQLVRLKTGGSMSGIAWVNVLCYPIVSSSGAGPYSYAEVLPTYNSLPTFSWTAVITHELGHNLGSPHTYSCSWSGGPIDNCYTQEGSCSPGPTPTNGGTIMSYCHLTSIGINFNNGFGPQPKALILSKISNATCVVARSMGSTCNAPVSLAATNVTTIGATLSWATVSGAVSYTVNYKLSTDRPPGLRFPAQLLRLLLPSVRLTAPRHMIGRYGLIAVLVIRSLPNLNLQRSLQERMVYYQSSCRV